MGASAQNVDFSNVKEASGFNRSRIKAGDYLAKIKGVEDAKAKDGVHQYLFSIQIVDKPGSVFPYYCKLQENQLWKLRNLFIAAGKTVPKKKVKVDPNQIVGKLIGVTIEDDEYEGKERSEVEGVFPASDLGDDASVPDRDEDDAEDQVDDDGDDLDLDEPAPKAKAAPEPEDDEEEEEAEEEPADELAGLDRNELKARIKKHQPDVKFRTSQSDDDLRDILQKLEAAPASSADEDIDDLDVDDL